MKLDAIGTEEQYFLAISNNIPRIRFKRPFEIFIEIFSGFSFYAMFFTLIYFSLGNPYFTNTDIVILCYIVFVMTVVYCANYIIDSEYITLY